jgi:hypothetical protein
MDNDYRKQWDKTVVEHNQLQVDESDGSEVGRTVKKFPLLKPREYVLTWKLWEGRDKTFYCYMKVMHHICWININNCFLQLFSVHARCYVPYVFVIAFSYGFCCGSISPPSFSSPVLFVLSMNKNIFTGKSGKNFPRKYIGQ